jgi:predicted TIM-barrel fold metal-dependent hydrolase
MHTEQLGIGLICDADSHLMPTRQWLAAHVDPAHRLAVETVIPDWVPALAPYLAGAQRQFAQAGSRAELMRNALGGPKSGLAPGALDPGERGEVLDELGLAAQLVLSTFVMPRLLTGALDPAQTAAIVTGHNRAMAEFAAGDPRVLPVGVLPFSSSAEMLAELERCLADGIAAVQVPSDAYTGRAPSHLEYEPVWAALAAADVPVICHIGGGSLLPAALHRDGRRSGPPGEDGGALPVKDFAVSHQSAERFLTCLILDGVLERHPDLRCAVLEQGAGWVPAFLRKLDLAAYLFRRDPVVQTLSLTPTQYVRRAVRFTPFYFEDVGQLTQECGPQLLMFSTDYPHFEGGTDPVGRFHASFEAAGTSVSERRRFFRDNFADLIGAPVLAGSAAVSTAPGSAP